MAARLSATLLRTQTDRRLTALAAGGSEPAFEALVERYRRPLQAYCRRLLLDAASAEDVVQQAFLSTWQTLRGGTAITDVKPWLFRVTHNGAINALKRSGYRHEELDDALSGASAPDEDLDRRIAVRRTLAGLASLPELQREALLRTAVEGRSHEEVARELGLTDGAVRGLIYRARATLRAAATAVTPAPLAGWVATWSGRETVPMAERITDLVAGGGGAGAAALLLKGSATVVATGAIAGGAVVAERNTSPDGPPVVPPTAEAAERPDRADAGAGAPDPVAPAGAAATHPGPQEERAVPARRARSERGDDDRAAAQRHDRDGDERDDDDEHGDDDQTDRSGRGGDGEDREETRDDSSGPGSGDGEPETEADRSGPGSGEITTRTDSSGPGSDDDPIETDATWSGSEPSGSSDEDEPDDGDDSGPG